MVTAPTTISELINCWPTVRAFAADIEVGIEAAFQMKKRNRIAPHHWARVMSAAEGRSIPGINHGWLMVRCNRTTRKAA